MDQATRQLEAALVKFLREFQKESSSPVAVISNWEKGTIQLQVGGK
ncbi:hypothetical protein [Halalkalibacter krulwichiae]|uniref:Uncharacterized protein n=1 Tax=Halalkalibacter krulwichiae TaxID=199441 RepID=A0A1X9M5N6_9BACI|nr:hypothetical protein [Halalkalibacter krulwichiae]ARK28758.1 hypothetical protein BkAM31D_02225 [Halalkalibacter krulwichiae]